MVKVQSITRANGNTIFNVTLPKDLIEHIGWIKGTKVEIIAKDSQTLIIHRVD